MARQTRTSAEITEVTNDFDTFQLPIDASLNLGEFTAYGTTDPDIALSMVNVRHLNATRDLRGIWVSDPLDGTTSIPYTAGQIVIGRDNQLYKLKDTGTGTNDPVVGTSAPFTVNTTDWTLIGGAQNDTWTVQGTTGTATNPTLRFMQGSHSAQDIQFTSDNMNIVKTGDRVIKFDATLPPTLISTPSSIELTAYSNQVNLPSLSVTPSSGTPTNRAVTQTNTSASSAISNLQISSAGLVTGQVPTNTPSASYTITSTFTITDAEVATISHTGITTDTDVTFVDRRNMPTVTPSVLSIPTVGTLDPTTHSFTYDLTPDGTVAAGLAYDINETGITGNSVTLDTANNRLTPDGIVSTTTVTVRFPNMTTSGTSQPTGNTDIPVMVETYIPFFYDASGSIPTALTSMTRSTVSLPGSEGTSITITGTANDAIYVAVPSTATFTNISTLFGAAMVSGVRVTGHDISVTDNGNQSVTYHLYRFGSLFGGSVTLNLISS